MADDHDRAAGGPPSPTPPPPPLDARDDGQEDAAAAKPVTVTVAYAGHTHTFAFEAEAVLDDLVAACEQVLGPDDHDWPSARFIAPKVGLLRALDKAEFPLAGLHGKRVNLMVPRAQDVRDLHAAEQNAARTRQLRAQRLAAARRHHGGGGGGGHHGGHRARAGAGAAAAAAEESTYTFLHLRPLPQFPDPQRSLAFLQRLRDDPGVRAAMRRHRFTVGLLTEMDPASHTAEGPEGTTRILGLNRNRGEVIELRLRTDAYDGYRDYRTIRRTLCHELAHNVHGPHDRAFWDLCRQVEREVERDDWTSGGRAVVEGEYAPERPGAGAGAGAGDDEEVMDHGGWTGGEFVLGGGGPSATGPGGEALSRREILRRAAEERIRKMNAQMPDKADEEGSRRSP